MSLRCSQQGEKVSSGFEEVVLRKLNSILAKLAILDNKMTQIESQMQMRKVSNKDLDELGDEISLPIKSMAQLDEIEERLKSRAFLEKMDALSNIERMMQDAYMFHLDLMQLSVDKIEYQHWDCDR